MFSRSSTLVVLLVVVVVAGAGIWLLSDAPPERAVPPKSAAPPRSESQPATSRVREIAAPPPTREPERPQEMVRYPDGTYFPPLNGVRIPAPMTWPENQPFYPVTKKRIMPNGEEWYVHADGALSRTVLVWRSDLGREDPVCQVLHALPPQPTELTDR